jgi:tetrapyrrole methylase family protein / MazG family protein
MTATITMIGLGPGDPGHLTRRAWELLQSLELLYLRTTVHPTVASLPPSVVLRSFDALYEQSASFDEIYTTIADELIGRARRGEAVAYAVPGHPLVAEATTREVLRRARAATVPVAIVDGVSFLEPICTALGLDPFAAGLQLLDALDLVPPAPTQSAERAWVEVQNLGDYSAPLTPYPLLPTRPALLCQLYSRAVASDVKLSLMERYPDEHPITLVRAAGVASQETVWTIPLYELDRQTTLDHLTCAYLPPLAAHADLRGSDGLQWVVARLLGPGGCPWDREQTHQSLRGGLLEEVYEVLEALDADDFDALPEELGDLLLQVVVHGEMARQAGRFDLGDVQQAIAAKLIRRHPHVFADLSVSGTGEVLHNWEAIKAQELAEKGRARTGTLDGVPPGLPALMAAQKVGKKAARVGFDWPELSGLWAKLHEEIAELRAEADAPSPDAARVADEYGDLLYVAANLGRRLGLDAEAALREATLKFRRRFALLETIAQGQDLRALDVQQLVALWEQAKAQDR